MILPVRKGKKWGGVNPGGHLVLPFAFDRLGDFSEGLISFAQGGRVGFLKADSTERVKPIFDLPDNEMPVFRQGRAAVSSQGRMGFIDPKGIWVVPPTWFRCCNYVGDKAFVESEQGYFVLDHAGQVISSLEVYDIAFSSNDWPRNWDCFKCLFLLECNFLVGFANWQGATVFAPRYSWMTDFSDGVAGFCDAEDDMSSPWGLVSMSGEIGSPPQFYCLRDFKNGLACAARPSLKEFGYINTQSDWVIEPIYRQALDFSDGLACITVSKGSKGFINARGEMVIEPRFSSQASFKDGYAHVEYEGKSALIDKTGRVIWETRIDSE